MKEKPVSQHAEPEMLLHYTELKKKKRKKSFGEKLSKHI